MAKAAALEEFHAVWNEEPAGIWSAPGRVNLIGEHTDYNDGLVLPFAIDSRTYVAARPRGDYKVSVASGMDPGRTVEWDRHRESPSGRGWASYVFGVVWALGGTQHSGVDIVITSDIPVGSGLSSSAALECATAVALRDLWNTQHSDEDLAAAGTWAENQVVGAPTGVMDQLASMLGRESHAVLIDCQRGTNSLVPLGFAAANLLCVVIDSHQRHDHSSGEYAQKRAACEQAAEILGIRSLREIQDSELTHALLELPATLRPLVRHVVTENARVEQAVEALGRKDFSTLGRILDKSHASLKDDFGVSTDYLDRIVTAATQGGAIGARLVGGGFGGSVMALVEESDVGKLHQSISDLTDPSTPHPATVRVVAPSDGARPHAK